MDLLLEMLKIEGEASFARLLRPGLSRVYPGRLGSGSIHRVDRVSLGQLPGGFLLRPGPVLGPGQPGPGSTRRAGPGFKTICSTALMFKGLPEHIPSAVGST